MNKELKPRKKQSNQQRILNNKLREIFGKKTCFIINYRPDWLKNPRTNENLEIDIYLPQYQIGFEYQGDHHLKSILGHNVDYVKYKDLLKNELANKKGVPIIEFFEWDLKNKNFKDLLIDRIKRSCTKKQIRKFLIILDKIEKSIYPKYFLQGKVNESIDRQLLKSFRY
jgi:hypothetical protein